MTQAYHSLPRHFDFDLGVYRLSAIKKAAYRFAGEFHVQIEPIAASQVRVSLSRRAEAAAHCDPNNLAAEVLDQELRELVAEETKSVRDLLLAQAFSGLALVDPVGEHADFREDPLGITAPQARSKSAE